MKKFMEEYGITIMLAIIIVLSIVNIFCSIKIIKEKLNQGTVEEVMNYPGERVKLEYIIKA